MTAKIQPSREAAAFRFGEFTFDCESRQLLHNGLPRHLSPKAQQLLQLLLLARPRALSHEEIYDALWPETYVCDTNLPSIVNEVRRALGDNARSPRYIRTAHGFGYAFCEEAAAAAPVASAIAMLRCEGSPQREASSWLLYEGENVVGRAPDVRVVIVDATVSRRHAVLTVANGEITVADLDSKNGTYVDGQKIGQTPVKVTPRTRIMFGAVVAWVMRRKVSSTLSLQLDEAELSRATAEIASSS
ncbi:MAG TPA: FHA domain-containing protein [Thermoanaerobaculia bacterium]